MPVGDLQGRGLLKPMDLILKRVVLIIFPLIVLGGIVSSCSQTKTAVKSAATEDIAADHAGQKGVVSEFIVGPGDELEITVFRHNDLNRKVRIPPDGVIFLPLIGEIPTKGVSIRQMRNQITEGYSRYLYNPQVSVEIIANRYQKVFVLGEVKNPGIFLIDTPISVLEAVSRAGGFTVDARQNSILLIRGEMDKPDLFRLDLKKALKNADLSQNPTLQRGDVVYVPATYIANVARYFQNIEAIIRPVVLLEQGIALYPQVQDVLTGKEEKQQPPTVIISPP